MSEAMQTALAASVQLDRIPKTSVDVFAMVRFHGGREGRGGEERGQGGSCREGGKTSVKVFAMVCFREEDRDRDRDQDQDLQWEGIGLQSGQAGASDCYSLLPPC